MTATDDPSVGSFVNQLPEGEWVHAFGFMWRKEADIPQEDE